MELHKKLEWSDYEWFKHKAEFMVDNVIVRCRSSKGKSQKILFSLPNVNKHVSAELTKSVLDLHVTYDQKGRPHKNIMRIPIRRTERKIRKEKESLTKYMRFVRFSKKDFLRFILVDPLSIKCLKNSSKLKSLSDIPLRKLLKMRVDPNEAIRLNKKKYFVYDLNRKCQGLVEVDTRRYGFKFCMMEPIDFHSQGIYNPESLRSQLTPEFPKNDYKNLSIRNKWSKIIGKIRGLFNNFYE